MAATQADRTAMACRSRAGRQGWEGVADTTVARAVA